MSKINPFLSVTGISCALLLSACTQPAVVNTAEAERPAFVTSDLVTERAKVLAVNRPERMVVLRGEDGGTLGLILDERVRNFDQIQVGDVVTAQYQEATAIFVRPATGAPTSNATGTLQTARPGEKPEAVILARETYAVHGSTLPALRVGAVGALELPLAIAIAHLELHEASALAAEALATLDGVMDGLALEGEGRRLGDDLAMERRIGGDIRKHGTPAATAAGLEPTARRLLDDDDDAFGLLHGVRSLGMPGREIAPGW